MVVLAVWPHNRAHKRPDLCCFARDRPFGELGKTSTSRLVAPVPRLTPKIRRGSNARTTQTSCSAITDQSSEQQDAFTPVD
jgi:hypothetical protein